MSSLSNINNSNSIRREQDQVIFCQGGGKLPSAESYNCSEYKIVNSYIDIPEITNIIQQYAWTPALAIGDLFAPHGHSVAPLKLINVDENSALRCPITECNLDSLIFDKLHMQPCRHHLIAMIIDKEKTTHICDAEAAIAHLSTENRSRKPKFSIAFPIITVHYFITQIGSSILKLVDSCTEKNPLKNVDSKIKNLILANSTQKSSEVTAARLDLLRSSSISNDERIRLYKLELLDNPNNLNYCITLSNLLSTRNGFNDLEKSATYLQIAAFLYSHNDVTQTKLDDVLESFGELQEAEITLTTAIAFNPKNDFVHAILGAVLLKLGKFKGAEAALTAATTLNPKDAFAHTLLGEVLLKLGKLTEAETALTAAITFNPKYVLAYRLLGEILLKLGKLTGAETAQRTATTLNPKDGVSHALLGEVLLKLGKLPEAETALTTAIAFNPKDASAHVLLGVVLLKLGKLTGAETALTAAITFNPKDALAHRLLGEVLLKLGKLTGAETALRTALTFNSKDALAHTLLGEILLKLVKLTEAETELRTAIELWPKNDFAHMLLSKVSLLQLSKSKEAEIMLKKSQ